MTACNGQRNDPGELLGTRSQGMPVAARGGCRRVPARWAVRDGALRTVPQRWASGSTAWTQCTSKVRPSALSAATMSAASDRARSRLGLSLAPVRLTHPDSGCSGRRGTRPCQTWLRKSASREILTVPERGPKRLRARERQWPRGQSSMESVQINHPWGTLTSAWAEPAGRRTCGALCDARRKDASSMSERSSPGCSDDVVRVCVDRVLVRLGHGWAGTAHECHRRWRWHAEER